MNFFYLTSILLPTASLFLVLMTGLGAFRLGKLLVREKIQFSAFLLNFAFYSGIGLAILSYAVAALVALNAVTKTHLWILCSVFALFAILELWEWKSVWAWLAGKINAQRWLILLLIVYYGFVWLGTSLPPYSRDELIYHLEIPKRILEQGGMPFFKNNFYAYFPQLGEMFFVFGLGTLGETAAKLFHSYFGFLLTLLLYGFSRQFLSRKNSLLTVVLFLTAPIVLDIHALAYVDLIYAFYAWLALVCLMQFIETAKRPWIFGTALMAGAAMATKYTGIQYLILLTILLLIFDFPRQRGKIFFTFLTMGACSLIIVAPYFLRNWLLTGWPLFPFPIFHLPLHEGIHWNLERSGMYLFWLSQFGIPLGKDPLGPTLLAPVLVFLRGKFNSPEFYEGVAGPVFLLIPFVITRKSTETARQYRVIRFLSIFSLLFLYYWALTTKQVRFLIPVLPCLCFLIAHGLEVHRKSFLYGLVLIGIAWNFFTGTQEIFTKHPWLYWFGSQRREIFLSQQIDVYEAYQKRIKRCQKTAKFI